MQKNVPYVEIDLTFIFVSATKIQTTTTSMSQLSIDIERAPNWKSEKQLAALRRITPSKSMTDNEKMSEAIAKAHPLPRLGMPEDSAAAAAFLLSSQSAWATGTILPVDVHLPCINRRHSQTYHG